MTSDLWPTSSDPCDVMPPESALPNRSMTPALENDRSIVDQRDLRRGALDSNDIALGRVDIEIGLFAGNEDACPLSAPAMAINRTAFTKSRLSAAVRPGSPALLGSRSLIRSLGRRSERGAGTSRVFHEWGSEEATFSHCLRNTPSSMSTPSRAIPNPHSW